MRILATILIFFKVLFYYCLIVVERIYLLPLSNLLPSDLDSVIANRKDAERLWTRIYVGSIVYGALLTIYCLIF